jgi:hypothetical protein
LRTRAVRGPRRSPVVRCRARRSAPRTAVQRRRTDDPAARPSHCRAAPSYRRPRRAPLALPYSVVAPTPRRAPIALPCSVVPNPLTRSIADSSCSRTTPFSGRPLPCASESRAARYHPLSARMRAIWGWSAARRPQAEHRRVGGTHAGTVAGRARFRGGRARGPRARPWGYDGPDGWVVFAGLRAMRSKVGVSNTSYTVLLDALDGRRDSARREVMLRGVHRRVVQLLPAPLLGARPWSRSPEIRSHSPEGRVREAGLGELLAEEVAPEGSGARSTVSSPRCDGGAEPRVECRGMGGSVPSLASSDGGAEPRVECRRSGRQRAVVAVE